MDWIDSLRHHLRLMIILDFDLIGLAIALEPHPMEFEAELLFGGPVPRPSWIRLRLIAIAVIRGAKRLTCKNLIVSPPTFNDLICDEIMQGMHDHCSAIESSSPRTYHLLARTTLVAFLFSWLISFKLNSIAFRGESETRR